MIIESFFVSLLAVSPALFMAWQYDAQRKKTIATELNQTQERGIVYVDASGRVTGCKGNHCRR